MLNKIVLTFIVVLIIIVLSLVAWLKSECRANKTLTTELNRLRNSYNGLQQDYANYKLAQQQKEEAHAQTQQTLADIATASSTDVINQLQHRKDRVRNKNSSSAVHISSTTGSK